MSLLADIVDGIAHGINSLFGSGNSAPATSLTQAPGGGSSIGGIVSGIASVAAPFLTAAVTAPDKPEYPKVPDSVKNDPRLQQLIGPAGGYDNAPTVNYPSAFQIAFPYAVNSLLSPSGPSFLNPQPETPAKQSPPSTLNSQQVQTPLNTAPTAQSTVLGPQQPQVQTPSGIPSQVAQMSIAKYEPLINAAASKYQVDPALLKAVITQESNGNPNAVGGVGEIGLTQIRPSTARDLMPGITRKDLFNPETNINASAAYLRKLTDTFGNDYDKVISSYNAGQGNVQRGTVSRKTTLNYLPRVKGFLDFYRGQTVNG